MTAPDADDAEAVASLRTVLEQSGYTQDRVQVLIGPEGRSAANSGWVAPVLARTEAGTPLDLLVRLFWALTGVARADLERALGSRCVEMWARAGLLTLCGERAEPVVGLQPVNLAAHDWVVAHDPRGAARPDMVVPVGPASRLLADMTVRHPVGRALDLGTGGGIQSLAASRHADVVIATDQSARAVDFARFTMALNGVTNVELRTGDRFEPVRNESFDLVVSNPPFVVSPATGLLFRDSSLPADQMSASVVRETGLHLAPGGWGVVLASWVNREGEAWEDHVRAWVDGTGCDVWAVQHRHLDPPSYAHRWMAHDDSLSGEERERQFGDWMAYYRREGIVGLGLGAVVLRKPELHRPVLHRPELRRSPWFVAEHNSDDVTEPSGDGIALRFRLEDWLREHGDEGLLAARLRRAPDVRLDTSSTAADDGWAFDGMVVRHPHGLRTSLAVSPAAADFLAMSDGRLPLAAVLSGFGAAPLDVDDAAVAGVLEVCRELVRRGFLIPVELA